MVRLPWAATTLPSFVSVVVSLFAWQRRTDFLPEGCSVIRSTTDDHSRTGRHPKVGVQQAMYTVKELCQKYPFLKPSTVYFWIEERLFAHYRLGKGKIVIDEDDFLAFLASRKVEPGQLRPEVKFTHARSPSSPFFAASLS